MSAQSDKAILGAASLLADSARSIDFAVEKMESLMAEQASVLDRLADSLDKMSGGGSSKPGGEDKGFSAFSGRFKDLVGSLESLGKAGEDIRDGFKALNEGIRDLGRAMTVVSKIPESAVTNLTNFLKNLSKEFESIDTAKIKEGGEGMKLMASGIALLGLSIFLSAPLYIVGAAASILIIPMIGLYAYLFARMGEVGEQIKVGAEAMGWMALGLVGFAIGLFAVRALSGGDWGEYAKGTMVVLAGTAVFATMFYFLGQFADPIEKGAKAMAWMGLALVSLAVGIAMFQFLNITIGSALIAGAAIAVTGIAMGLVGMFSAQIEEGAIALAFAGASLIILALGLGSFRLFGITSEDYLNAGAAVLAVGGAMLLAGFMAIPILLGAAALILASVALITLAGGISVMDLVYKKAVNGLLAPSPTNPKETNLGVVITGIADAFFINPVKSAFMILGAAALLIASVALITLAGGIMAFNFAYSKAKDGLLGPDPLDKETIVLDTVITGIVSAFYINPIKSAFMLVGAAALIVASVALITLSGGLLLFNFTYKKLKDSGLFDASVKDPEISNFENVMGSIVSGLVIGPIDMIGLYAAVPAWLMAGLALTTIGAGVAQFAKIVEKNINVDRIGDMISKVLTAAIDVFVGVGSGDLVDWDDVEDGIDAVSDVGNLIAGIAEGVAKMADLKFPIYGKDGKISSYFTIGDKQFSQVAINMKLVIGAIAGILTDIGKSQGETGWFSKTDGEKGADVIRGIGGDLVGLADFVQKAANLTFPIYDKDGKQIGVTTLSPDMLASGGSVSQNIISMITAVTSALAAVGSGAAASSGWFVDSDIEKGKEAIAGVAGDINGIAQMVQTMAQIQDFSQVEERIKRSIIVIPEALLGAEKIITANKEKLFSVNAILSMILEPLSKMTDLLAKAEEKKVSEKTGRGLGQSIKSIFEGMSSLSKDANFNAMDLAVSYLERMAAAADPLEKLADSFGKIAKTMDRFGASFKKMNPQAVKTSDMLIQSLVVFSKVDPNAFNSATNKGQALLRFIYEKGTPVKPEAPATPAAAAPMVKNEPGKTQLAPAAAANKKAEAQQASMMNQQMQQMMLDLTDNMGRMANALKDIKMILQGTLKVEKIN